MRSSDPSASSANAEKGETHRMLSHAMLMRAERFRQTPQRELILEAICEDQGRTCVCEVGARVRVGAPSTSRATNHWARGFFCELGVAVSADSGDGRKRYEIAGESPHRQACRVRGCAEDAQRDLGAGLLDRIPQEWRILVDMRYLLLCGVRVGSQRRAHPV